MTTASGDSGDDGPGGSLEGVRVLVVEDEAVVAFDLEFSLRDLGCEVLPLAATVADALALLADGRPAPDIVLLDVNLADGPAAPLARHLRDAGVPYIVATGYGGEQIADPLLRDAPRLAKPYGPDELRRALLAALRRDATG